MATRLNAIGNHIKTQPTSNPIPTHTMASSPSSISMAILDDYPNIAPPHFSHLQNLKITSYPQTLNAAKQDGLDNLINRLHPYQIISTMRERTAFPAELQRQLPNLKLLMTTGPRNASIDMACAKDRGILVTGTKGDQPTETSKFSTDDIPPPPKGNSVNQHSWALLLGLASRLPRDDHAVKADPEAWQSGLAIPLGGKVLGVVGLGKLGQLMAKTGVLGFGMEVIAWSENLTQEKADAAAERDGLSKGTYRAVSKEEMYKRADVVSLHLVLSERSRGVVGEKELGMMKKSALLLNTSRGGLIDEPALLKTLKEGGIRGAALDVYWEEPLPPDSPWRSREFKSELVLSPHMGYVNAGTMNRWYQEQAEIVEKWMKGEDVPNKIE